MAMQVLAYLLADPPSPEGGPDIATRILFGDRETDEGDEEHLQLFSNILLNLEREGTYNALHKSLPFEWYDKRNYDTVNPFGDSRQSQYYSLWTFDIQKDILHFTNHDHRSQMPLSLLRDRIVSMADMEPLGGPVPLPLSLKPQSDPGTSYWKPRAEIDDRLRAFTHRLLRDFHHQWRHILRNHFNLATLRVLAKAIIRLSALDFEIHENTGGHGPRGAHVWISQLPPWEPFKTDFERAGNVHLVLCQEIHEGLLTAKRHLSSQEFSVTGDREAVDDSELQANYMVLSVKHIMLCYATSSTSLMNTAPEPLFNGDYGSGSPSELALDYLIWSTASARSLIVTPLQSLPVEIQDMMLEYTSVGTVKAAKFGCLLGLGSPFPWKDGPLDVTLAERHYVRPTGSSVESQVWFGEHRSGIVYLAR